METEKTMTRISEASYHQQQSQVVGFQCSYSRTMSALEPDTLRPSEEKIDPAERVEKAKKLKEEGNAKFKSEEFAVGYYGNVGRPQKRWSLKCRYRG